MCGHSHTHELQLQRYYTTFSWICQVDTICYFLENMGFRGRNKKIHKYFLSVTPKMPSPTTVYEGRCSDLPQTYDQSSGTDRPYHNENIICGERRQRTCQADRTHRAGISAVLHSFPTVRNTVKSTVPSTRRTQGQQAAEATARHGTEPASVTLRHIRCVWSALRPDATSRRPMSTISSRTEETVFSSGIRATGRASVTDTTASRPETRITPLSTSTEKRSLSY